MTAAPVGFQCPSCVSEGQTRLRRAGGGRRSGATALTRVDYPATVALITTNALVFAWSSLVGHTTVILNYGLLGVEVATGDTYRLITATVLHASLTHLAFNMFALWFLGSALEPMIGTAKFLVVYLVSAVAGAAVSYAFSSPFVPSVGASGAVFGLLGAVYVVLRRQDRDVTSITVVLAINVALGFLVAGIDWRAHLGGLVAGAVVTAAIAYAPPRHARLALGGATLAVLGVVVLMVSWRTQDLTSFF